MIEVIDGRETMYISSVDRRTITGQSIVNGRLVTEFKECLFGGLDYPAGVLVCEPVEEGVPHINSVDKNTPEQMRSYEPEDCTSSYVLGESVTRLGKMFWDRGVLTRRL